MLLSDLITALEKASGPDRELDEAISAFLFPDHEFMQLKDAPAGVGCMMYRWPDGQQSSALRATASIDAAVALVERFLPGWFWRTGHVPIPHFDRGEYWDGWAYVSRTDASNCDRCDEAAGWSKTPALALVIATLRALQHRGGGDG